MSKLLLNKARQSAEFAHIIGVTHDGLTYARSTSLQEIAWSDLRKKAALLVREIDTGKTRELVIAAQKDLEGAIETAAILGVISAKEREELLEKTDEIYNDIDREL